MNREIIEINLTTLKLEELSQETSMNPDIFRKVVYMYIYTLYTYIYTLYTYIYICVCVRMCVCVYNFSEYI